MSWAAAFGAVVRAVWSSLWLAVVPSSAVLVVLEMVGAVSFSGLWLGPIVFGGLALVHELGHLAMIRMAGSQVLEVEWFRWRTVCIIHRRAGRSRDLACVVAGPALATVAGLGGAVIVEQPIARFCLGVVAVAHAASLASPVGDGAELRVLLGRPSR